MIIILISYRFIYCLVVLVPPTPPSSWFYFHDWLLFWEEMTTHWLSVFLLFMSAGQRPRGLIPFPLVRRQCVGGLITVSFFLLIWNMHGIFVFIRNILLHFLCSFSVIFPLRNVETSDIRKDFKFIKEFLVPKPIRIIFDTFFKPRLFFQILNSNYPTRDPSNKNSSQDSQVTLCSLAHCHCLWRFCRDCRGTQWSWTLWSNKSPKFLFFFKYR